MNRSDIVALQAQRTYPSISIFVPTYRTSPDNQRDPIRVKNGITAAANRLEAELGKRDAAPYLAELEALAEEIDYEHALDSLALYVSSELTAKFYLPFRVAERVIIDETFATRDLVFALNRSPRYRVLVLSEQPTRLFEGVGSTLEEVFDFGFPLTHGRAGGATRLPGGHGISRSQVRDQAQRDFMTAIDRALAEAESAESLPLIVVGIGRNISFFREVTSQAGSIVGTVEGSHDRTPAHELAALVAPVLHEALAERRAGELEALGRAVGAQKYASGIDQVWRAAAEGRAEVVLVEEGFHYPATLSSDGMTLTAAEDASADGVIDDAVDELIEAVLLKGGRAVFVEDGKLAEHQRVALVLRY